MATAPARRQPIRSARCPKRGVRVVAGALLLAAAGCSTPPDMSGFDTATRELGGSLRSTGRAVGDELTAATGTWSPEQRERVAALRASFDRAWGARNGLAAALEGYSASLTDIVEAGEQGRQSAMALAGVFGKLCAAIDVALPVGGAAGAVVRTGADIYGRFTLHYAAQTLATGMAEMQPFVDEVADRLAADLTDAEEVLATLREAAPLEGGAVGGFDAMAVRGQRDALAGRAAALRTDLAAVGTRIADVRRIVVNATPPGAPTPEGGQPVFELEVLTNVARSIEQDLAATEQSIERLTGMLRPADEAIAAAEARIDRQIGLVRAARAGLTEWAAAHEELGRAAAERRVPRVEELVRIAEEIRERVRELRNL